MCSKSREDACANAVALELVGSLQIFFIAILLHLNACCWSFSMALSCLITRLYFVFHSTANTIAAVVETIVAVVCHEQYGDSLTVFMIPDVALVAGVNRLSPSHDQQVALAPDPHSEMNVTKYKSLVVIFHFDFLYRQRGLSDLSLTVDSLRETSVVEKFVMILLGVCTSSECDEKLSVSLA